MSIEVKNVTKNFGPIRVLNNVNLRIDSGELVALLGPSGCGKTSLLRIIAGLETADFGSIYLEDDDATMTDARERQVGFVFQHYALFRHMSVFENVAFGLRVRPRAQHAERLVTDLPAMAVGAVEHSGAPERGDPGNVWKLVDGSGGHDHGTGAQRDARAVEAAGMITTPVDDQHDRGHAETEGVDRAGAHHPAPDRGIGLGPQVPGPVPDHAELAQRERHEDADDVELDQLRDVGVEGGELHVQRGLAQLQRGEGDEPVAVDHPTQVIDGDDAIAVTVERHGDTTATLEVDDDVEAVGFRAADQSLETFLVIHEDAAPAM